MCDVMSLCMSIGHSAVRRALAAEVKTQAHAVAPLLTAVGTVSGPRLLRTVHTQGEANTVTVQPTPQQAAAAAAAAPHPRVGL
jgi:hypothetical protein